MLIGLKKWLRRSRDQFKTRRGKFQANIYQFLHDELVETQIFAHRGSKSNRPENTLAAFSEAIKVGADGIELDVHLTKDNQLVVIHDESIDRTTNGTGLVRNLTFSELQQFSAGSWFSADYTAEKVPLLSEVLDLLTQLKFTGVLNVEIKTDKFQYVGIEKMTSDLLTSQQFSFSHSYSSFNLQSIQRLSELEPDADFCLLMSTSEEKMQLGLATDYISHLHPRLDWLKKNAGRLDKLGKPLRPWTLNNDVDIYFAFNHQLSGFMTDYPALAVEIKKRYNQKK
ncbi:glycerophosphodiester phosphodiesterase family protein [Pseudolactococcus reticulitermitis]|uniref:Glycerophosphodiester phosphodiesterase n=1 Tax=Pseudolactococcus reticulitermitis TaxID=2025039 RepID=A0A224XEG1_9LACT|nr:glycerophosphodiester phosphodiesterase family protein [Lactococcus reticulitermitis]GAX47963.1 glycerophosphodiester phosphodiesterase [Lactococcus reticulitermitis]